MHNSENGNSLLPHLPRSLDFFIKIRYAYIQTAEKKKSAVTRGEQNLKDINIEEKSEYTIEKISDSGIRVIVRIPDDVPEVIRQQKINQIYDILVKSENKN